MLLLCAYSAIERKVKTSTMLLQLFVPQGRYAQYNRDDIKALHSQKQAACASESALAPEEATPPSGAQAISELYYVYEHYHDCLAKDFIEGQISEDEYYGHLEDIFNAKAKALNATTDDKKQQVLDAVLLDAHNGIRDYVSKQHIAEAESARLKSPSSMTFYYNTDHHYQHEERKEEFIKKSNVLADKLGLNGIEERLRTNISTFHGLMANILAQHSGQFVDFGMPPPPGMKITLGAARSPYFASINCDGKDYNVILPFSYDLPLKYELKLSDVMDQCGLKPPEKFRAFIENIKVVESMIARSDPHRPSYVCSEEEMYSAVKSYDQSMNAAAAIASGDSAGNSSIAQATLIKAQKSESVTLFKSKEYRFDLLRKAMFTLSNKHFRFIAPNRSFTLSSDLQNQKYPTIEFTELGKDATSPKSAYHIPPPPSSAKGMDYYYEVSRTLLAGLILKEEFYNDLQVTVHSAS